MQAGPFVVNVAVLRRNHGTTRRERVEAPLADLGVTGSSVPGDEAVVVDVALDSVPGAVVAHGRVAAPWVGECRRCLGPVRGGLDVEVREVFEEASDALETYPLRGDYVDLEPMARDAVLLELPPAPLCSEQCEGLCPTCGANRNEGDCGCPSAVVDQRWAALDALKQDLEATDR